VLLDECVPRQLRRDLVGHEVRTVLETGWAGTKNGELLKRAEADFDVLLTTDQGIGFQQNLKSPSIAVIVVAVGSNDVNVLRPFVPQMLEGTSEYGRYVKFGPLCGHENHAAIVRHIQPFVAVDGPGVGPMDAVHQMAERWDRAASGCQMRTPKHRFALARHSDGDRAPSETKRGLGGMVLIAGTMTTHRAAGRSLRRRSRSCGWV
jgi:hypothetical protein